MFPIAVGSSLLTTLVNPWMIRISDPVGDWAEKRLPLKAKEYLTAYRGWVERIGESRGSEAFAKCRGAAIRLGVYAVLFAAAATACKMICRFDYSRFSVSFEKYDHIFFFCLANLAAVAILPLVVPAARQLGAALGEMLCGTGEAKWQVQTRKLVVFTALSAALALWFVEWSMIVVSTAPDHKLTFRISLAFMAVAATVGWKFFKKAGKKATENFREALTIEERQESAVRMMTVTVPEDTISRLTLVEGSPAIGKTVVSLNIRAKTGASIVSVIREGRITRNVGPDWKFAVGDTLVALGDETQINALKTMI